MVIFHSYVSLPEGTTQIHYGLSIKGNPTDQTEKRGTPRTNCWVIPYWDISLPQLGEVPYFNWFSWPSGWSPFRFSKVHPKKPGDFAIFGKSFKNKTFKILWLWVCFGPFRLFLGLTVWCIRSPWWTRSSFTTFLVNCVGYVNVFLFRFKQSFSRGMLIQMFDLLVAYITCVWAGHCHRTFYIMFWSSHLEWRYLCSLMFASYSITPVHVDSVINHFWATLKKFAEQQFIYHNFDIGVLRFFGRRFSVYVDSG